MVSISPVDFVEFFKTLPAERQQRSPGVRNTGVCWFKRRRKGYPDAATLAAYEKNAGPHSDDAGTVAPKSNTP